MWESNQGTQGEIAQEASTSAPGSGLGTVSGDSMQKNCTSSRSAKASKLEPVNNNNKTASMKTNTQQMQKYKLESKETENL